MGTLWAGLTFGNPNGCFGVCLQREWLNFNLLPPSQNLVICENRQLFLRSLPFLCVHLQKSFWLHHVDFEQGFLLAVQIGVLVLGVVPWSQSWMGLWYVKASSSSVYAQFAHKENTMWLFLAVCVHQCVCAVWALMIHMLMYTETSMSGTWCSTINLQVRWQPSLVYWVICTHVWGKCRKGWGCIVCNWLTPVLPCNGVIPSQIAHTDCWGCTLWHGVNTSCLWRCALIFPCYVTAIMRSQVVIVEHHTDCCKECGGYHDTWILQTKTVWVCVWCLCTEWLQCIKGNNPTFAGGKQQWQPLGDGRWGRVVGREGAER